MPLDKEFSITVPATITLRQGAERTVDILLNRGPYFKQNVRMTIESDGIGVAPSNALIRSGDRPNLQVSIAASRSAAIGDYRVVVKGTPETGQPATAVFVVKVVSQ